jgi:hypothetical protein
MSNYKAQSYYVDKYAMGLRQEKRSEYDREREREGARVYPLR